MTLIYSNPLECSKDGIQWSNNITNLTNFSPVAPVKTKGVDVAHRFRCSTVP